VASAEYPGLQLDGAPRTEEFWNDFFHDEHPPISFVCAPIRAGEAVLGAIRLRGRFAIRSISM